MRSLSTIIALVACLVLAGCDNQSKQPKEKFFRGDIVIHKLDRKQGIVVGKRYVDGWNIKGANVHDCWEYDVRFSSTTDSVKVYEIELEKP